MTPGRVSCVDCGASILPETAAAHGGLCARCAKIPEALRRERREHEHRLARGSLFRPSPEELASARSLAEPSRGTRWHLEPEYHPDVASVADALDRAIDRPSGHVFAVSDAGTRLNLAFNEEYGVCEHQVEDTGASSYAYTPENLDRQVREDHHLLQACPCCGVGMLWFPSRFHMPRARAFEIVGSVVTGRSPADVQWLDSGDISYTACGRG